ncbi:Rhomboid protease GlpG [Candidatus Tiddalikarchaeum anstoanum]|nr:Rhomboid protease GlpG [Candidatus Tiddalikarchaeum anstoanum]
MVEYTYDYYSRKPGIQVNYGKVTLALIIICVAVFFLLPEAAYEYLMFNSNYVLARPWTLITNAFLHADIFHLLFNMFSLFMFGSILELRHGSKFIILLLVLSVILGNILFGIFNPGVWGLGISGYVFGLIGAAVILEPKARVIFPIGYIYTTAPISLAGPIMFLGEVIFSLLGGDGIGHVAHAAGFIAGVVLAYIKKKFTHKEYEYTIEY